MDDLLSEDWQASSKPASTAPSNPTSSYNSFRISSQPSSSGRSTPANLSRPASTVNGSAKPANDSFSNLFASKAQQKPGANLSIQERQKQLIEERRRQQQEQSALWDNLGSGRTTPEVRGRSPVQPQAPAQNDDDDVLAAFNKAAQAPVNKASHFPPPSSAEASGRSTPTFTQPAQPEVVSNGGFDDNDDPFGLGSAPQRINGHDTAPASTLTDGDDILGDLGKPVSLRPAQKASEAAQHQADEVFEQMQESAKSVNEHEDQAFAELVDMGFPADTAKIALEENGGDVQGAVGWLLQQAHDESKQKARAEAIQTRRPSPGAASRSPQRRQRDEKNGTGMPVWMREERSGSETRRQDSRPPANGEKDATKIAQEFGSKLFKGANSLWKASQKQMAKTVAEFQQERDPSQPKWMQDPAESSRPSSQRRAAQRSIEATAEAAMLDAPREKPHRPTKSSVPPAEIPFRERTPVESALPAHPTPQPRFMQQPPQPDKRPTTRLSRQDVEEQSAQAYISPARRKKATPKPEPSREPEVDFFSLAPVQQSKTAPAPTSPRPSPASTPVRPKAPPRTIPFVSPTALATSAKHRKAGGEAFKRGDFDAAHQSYTAALAPMPATHPIMIVVLSNRSLTALKTGDAKSAVSDADKALGIIGVNQGAGESIDLGAGEGSKDMKEFYGKALMRKAEALEHMEKWIDAESVWRQAISAGVGGAISIRGRDRCEKAAAPKPVAPKPVTSTTASAPSKAAPPARSLGNSMQRPTITSASEAAAVKKLREANAAAEKADDEKFALADQVDARLTAWKGGKADNLRALLQSLDTVLWESAGWRSVGMSDLVMPNKVKIIYMKAIAKVHPDKIPQDATTEQRMISGAVFSTLNEAWDKFRKENNL